MMASSDYEVRVWADAGKNNCEIARLSKVGTIQREEEENENPKCI